MEKKNRGRQKLQIVRMENHLSRQVTFSKRRYGLFKKASELVTLCGAEVALIVFSPAGKVFTFSNPDFRTVIANYNRGRLMMPAPSAAVAAVNNNNNNNPHHLGDLAGNAQRAIFAVDLTRELDEEEKLLEQEKRIGDMLGERIKNSSLFGNRSGKFCVDKLNRFDLCKYKLLLEELRFDIEKAMELQHLNLIQNQEVMMMNNITTTTIPTLPHPPPVDATTTAITTLPPPLNTTTTITTLPPPPNTTTTITTLPHPPPVDATTTTAITTLPPPNTTTAITTLPPPNTTTAITTLPPPPPPNTNTDKLYEMISRNMNNNVFDASPYFEFNDNTFTFEVPPNDDIFNILSSVHGHQNLGSSSSSWSPGDGDAASSSFPPPGYI